MLRTASSPTLKAPDSRSTHDLSNGFGPSSERWNDLKCTGTKIGATNGTALGQSGSIGFSKSGYGQPLLLDTRQSDCPPCI